MTMHFDQDRLNEICDIVLELIGYDANVRSVALGGLPAGFRGILPGAGALPKISIRLDTQYLNEVNRLQTGVVPIKRWLMNVLSLVGTLEDADPLRQALADLEKATTGAPRVSVAVSQVVNEKLIFRNDMVPFSFLAGGLEAAKAVAKLVVPRYENGAPKMNGANPVVYLGTGWLIAPGLLATNHHVFNAREDGEGAASEADLRQQAVKTRILLDYDGESMGGTPIVPKELVAWDAALDYALLRVADDGRRPLVLAPQKIESLQPDTALAVNIIQHPDGNPKKFGIRNNLVAAVTSTELQYFTDTLAGSSGAPVLNDLWQVVALHRGSAFVKGVKFQGREVPYVNVGTQLTAVIADLRQRYAGKLPELSI